MGQCFLCKKKLSFLEGYSDGENYCERCWKNRQDEIKKIIQKTKLEEDSRIKEEKILYYFCPKCNRTFIKENKIDTMDAVVNIFSIFSVLFGSAGLFSWKKLECPDCNICLKRGKGISEKDKVRYYKESKKEVDKKEKEEFIWFIKFIGILIVLIILGLIIKFIFF